MPVFNDTYDIVGPLGEGNTSKVYLGKHRQTGHLSAIKVIKEDYLARSEESIL